MDRHYYVVRGYLPGINNNKPVLTESVFTDLLEALEFSKPFIGSKVITRNIGEPYIINVKDSFEEED